jgi:hypothetical protein
MKTAETRYATEQRIAEEEALKKGMEAKSKEFVEKDGGARPRKPFIQGYHLIKQEDLFWRPSNLMRIPNADYLERTGRLSG